MRWVVDTNVVFSAFLWRGIPHAVLQALAQDSRHRIFSSPPLLHELADVLTRPAASARLAVVRKSVSQVLGDYIASVELVQPLPLVRPICRDPDDDHILACALAANADLIVSGDKDLLVLQSFEGIPIVTAAQAMQRIAA